MSFNLITEPWIMVSTDKGDIETLSLRETFSQASRLSSLACELPVVDMAVLRLLVAIAIRATTCWYDDAESELEPYAVWKKMWDNEQFMTKVINDYLGNWQHRFDLLDAEDPFMQAPRMKAANGAVKGVRAIILDFPDSRRGSQFSQRTDEATKELSYAEATRWLLTCHAWDVAGIKTGMLGDSRTNNGRCAPQGTGWLGAIGPLALEGNNLHETILLNAPLWDASNHEEMHAAEDLPAWERPTETARDAKRTPTGVVDVLTWQSRRVWLIDNEERHCITGVLMTNGDRISFVNQYNCEFMTAWRRNASMEKREKSATPLYTPIGHMPERALWRGLNALLPQARSESDSPNYIMPGNLMWVGYLASPNARRVLPSTQRIRVHAIGISYGTQSAVIDEMVDDAVVICPVLLTEEGAVADGMVRECIDKTDQAVYVLKQFGQNLMATINGKSDEPTSEGLGISLQREAYLVLNQQFVTWLAGIGETTNLIEAQSEWMDTVKGILGRIAYDAVSAMPPAAYVGRECKTGRQSGYATAGSVESTFQWRLARIVSTTDNSETNTEADKKEDAE